MSWPPPFKHYSKQYASKLDLIHLTTKLCTFLDKLDVTEFKRGRVGFPAEPGLKKRAQFVDKMMDKYKAGDGQY